MNRGFITLILGSASVLIAGLLALYWSTFGFTRSQDQAVWGAFGDYFAGILNPIFALFAFIAVLWSLHLQLKQIGQIATDKHGEEILLVIKDLDTRIAEHTSSSKGEFNLTQLILEAQQAPKKFERSEDLSRFLRRAAELGSEAEGITRNLSSLVVSMYDFLQRHPAIKDGKMTPVIEYYIDKTSKLIPLINTATTLESRIVDYFNFKR